MNLTQSEMKRLSDLAWKDQMDAKTKADNKSFLRTGRMALVALAACSAVWVFVIYEIVAHA